MRRFVYFIAASYYRRRCIMKQTFWTMLAIAGLLATTSSLAHAQYQQPYGQPAYNQQPYGQAQVPYATPAQQGYGGYPAPQGYGTPAAPYGAPAPTYGGYQQPTYGMPAQPRYGGYSTRGKKGRGPNTPLGPGGGS